MPFSLRSISPKLLLPIAALCLAAPVVGQPRWEVERADIVRELKASRERVKRLEERLQQLDERRAQLASSNASFARAEDGCATPFFLGPDGVKHIRPECLVVAVRSTCERNPFAIDAHGIKRLHPACLQAATIAPSSTGSF